jgi:hypothetical protein
MQAQVQQFETVAGRSAMVSANAPEAEFVIVSRTGSSKVAAAAAAAAAKRSSTVISMSRVYQRVCVYMATSCFR